MPFPLEKVLLSQNVLAFLLVVLSYFSLLFFYFLHVVCL